MAALLFKLFPTLWPFLIEMILGGKDHPHSFGREENKKPGLTTILLFTITALVYTLATTVEEKEKLAKELIEANKPSSKVQDLSVSLYICEKAKLDLGKEIIVLENRLDVANRELLVHNSKPPLECPVVTPSTPTTNSPSLADKARQRLENIRNKD